MSTWAPITKRVINNGFGESRNGNTICGIIIHHAASTNALAYVAGDNDRNSHPTYHIANDGAVTGIVHPDRRPYSTAHDVDEQAITVEIDNSEAGGDWPISNAAYSSLLLLIAQTAVAEGYTAAATSIRGVDQPEFFIGYHSQYTATGCPGPYLTRDIEGGDTARNANTSIAAILHPPVKPPVVTPPVVTPPVVTPPVVVPPVVDPPVVVPPKPNVVSIDLDKLDELGTAIGEQVGPYIPRDTRRKVYEVVRNISAACAAAGTVALSTAGVVGGEIGVKIAVASAILTTVSTAIAALATGLAKNNT